MLIHSVYFWLKPETTTEQREAFAAGLDLLLAIPEIHEGFVGLPAKTSRPVVDSSYDFALIEHFYDLAAHDAYQVRLEHKRFVEQFSPLWDRVQIYDVQS